MINHPAKEFFPKYVVLNIWQAQYYPFECSGLFFLEKITLAGQLLSRIIIHLTYNSWRMLFIVLFFTFEQKLSDLLSD